MIAKATKGGEFNLTPDISNGRTLPCRLAKTLLNGGLVVRLSQVASVLALGMKTHMRKKMEQNEEKLAENELLEVGDIGLDDDAAEHACP